jgi:hypothetical protein
MTFEQIAVGLQLAVIAILIASACAGPLIYSFWKNRKK